MKQHSLIRRLWIASALLLPTIVAISAFTLNRAYVNSLNSAEYDALFAQIYALLALAEPEEDSLSLPQSLPNPRFETAESGLYARVLDQQQNIIWASNSLQISALDFPIPTQPAIGQHSEHNDTLNNKRYRSLSFTTVWDINGRDHQFSIEIIHNQAGKQQEIRAYQHALFLWLGGMTVLLILTQLLITHWGLKPLRRLAKEIGAIEAGHIQTVEHNYPVEIQPITRSLNALINSEHQQRERYKNALADLAHSLKTPLAVIRAQLGHSQHEHIIDDNVERMNTIITHQLKRASAKVRTIYSSNIRLAPLIQRIEQALIKVYADKQLNIRSDVANELLCAMEENDLMEALGNIYENACKYCQHTIHIHAHSEDDMLHVYIEDDGPGIQQSIAETVLERGARADTANAGQGIGLSIAIDIISSYNGALKINQSKALGGAAITLIIPSAPNNEK